MCTCNDNYDDCVGFHFNSSSPDDEGRIQKFSIA